MHAVCVNPHAVHFGALGLVLFSPRVQARPLVYGLNDFGQFTGCRIKASRQILDQDRCSDTVPEKNNTPLPLKINKAQVGFPFELLIFASEPDGDVVTISVDCTSYPFTVGATFDSASGAFS